MRKRLLAWLTAAILLLCSTAVADNVEKTSDLCFNFDTVLTFTVYGADDTLLYDMKVKCNYYENLLSKTIEGSDVWRINHANGEPVTVDPETWEILRRAKEISDLTDHAFSITIAPVAELWDFTGGTERIPSEEELSAALALVDDDALVLGDDYTVTLQPGMEIDLGGIAKGYIADQLSVMSAERSVGALLSFGSSSIYCTGAKPNGSPWSVGVTDPDSPTEIKLIVYVNGDTSVTSSGTYERFFEKDGVRYHHILDPETGKPSHSGVEGVSIVNTSAMDADAIATACIVLGRDGALELLTKLGMDGLVIETDGTVSTTDGFAEAYNLTWYKK